MKKEELIKLTNAYCDNQGIGQGEGIDLEDLFNFLSENQLTERINSLSGVVKCIVDYAYDDYLPGEFKIEVKKFRLTLTLNKPNPSLLLHLSSILRNDPLITSDLKNSSSGDSTIFTIEVL